MKPLASIDATTFSELLDLCHVDGQRGIQDGDEFAPNGSFIQQKRNGSELYWYYRGYERSFDGIAGKATLKYVGRVGDAAVEALVTGHEVRRANYRQRRNLVSRLKRIGLPSPHPIEAAVTKVLTRTGVLAAGAALVGSAAFQTLGGLMGVKLEEALHRTQDLDVAQPPGLVVNPASGGTIDLLEELREIDGTFSTLRHADEPDLVAGYVNASNFRLEFLTPMRAARSGSGRLAKVAGLPGVGAQKLRYLEFVLRDPRDSVMLHEQGILVPVPDPARFAVHKLIVAANRSDQGGGGGNFSKALKDVLQAQDLIGAAEHARTTLALGEAWLEAWNAGPNWRRVLRQGTLRLSPKHLGLLADATNEAAIMDSGASPFLDGDAPRETLLAGAGPKGREALERRSRIRRRDVAG